MLHLHSGHDSYSVGRSSGAPYKNPFVLLIYFGCQLQRIGKITKVHLDSKPAFPFKQWALKATQL